MWSISQGFQLKLFKVGEDDLEVRDVTISAGLEVCSDLLFWEVGCSIHQVEEFSCGRYDLGLLESGLTKRRQTNKCRIRVNSCHYLLILSSTRTLLFVSRSFRNYIVFAPLT